MRMYNRVGIALAAAMVFLLGAPVQAATVIFDPDDSMRAIGVENLDIAGVSYDVHFTPDLTAGLVYGEFPSNFDFITSEAASVATIAVNNALNAQGGVFSVGGAENDVGRVSYLVGFESESEGEVERVVAWEAQTLITLDDWSIMGLVPEVVSYLEPRVWATFTVVPEPVPSLSPLAIALLGALLGAASLRRLRA